MCSVLHRDYHCRVRMLGHATGDVSLSDEVRFAPSPELVGQNNVILKSPPGVQKENYHPDMTPSGALSPPLPPTSNLRFKVYIIIVRQRGWRKVMFSVVSVRHSEHGGGGVPCDHYLWCIGLRQPGTPSPRTCWNLFIMKHVRLESGQLVSYWNTFLFWRIIMPTSAILGKWKI